MYSIFLLVTLACKTVTPLKPLAGKLQISTRDDSLPVKGTDFTLDISESSHKALAPRGRICVLAHNGDQKAETCWETEEGKFERGWKAIGGNRWVAETESYEDVYIDGWQIRLDSIDKTHANASAKTISISLREAP